MRSGRSSFTARPSWMDFHAAFIARRELSMIFCNSGVILSPEGIFGMLAYLWIYLSMMKAFFTRIRLPSRALASEAAMMFSYIIGYLMVCFSDNMLHYLSFNWYFWFFTGLILAAARIPAAETSS